MHCLLPGHRLLAVVFHLQHAVLSRFFFNWKGKEGGGRGGIYKDRPGQHTKHTLRASIFIRARSAFTAVVVSLTVNNNHTFNPKKTSSTPSFILPPSFRTALHWPYTSACKPRSSQLACAMFGEDDDGLFSSSSGAKVDDDLFPNTAGGARSKAASSGSPLSALLHKTAAALEEGAARASGLENEVERMVHALATAESAATAAEKALQQTAEVVDSTAAAALADAMSRADAAEAEAAQLRAKMSTVATDAEDTMGTQAAELKAATVRPGDKKNKPSCRRCCCCCC